jgi:hypothetical protein
LRVLCVRRVRIAESSQGMWVLIKEVVLCQNVHMIVGSPDIRLLCVRRVCITECSHDNWVPRQKVAMSDEFIIEGAHTASGSPDRK